MLFSIITVCKNDENRIKDTMLSVQQQDCRDYEHIIEDGCSVDETDKRINTFCKEYINNNIVLYVEKDKGIYDAMNKAVQKANGEYICFLNAGDVFADNTILDKVMQCIKKDPSGDFFYGSAIIAYPDRTEHSQITAICEDKMRDIEVLESTNFHLIHQAIFARKTLLERFGFNLNYRLRAELDWYYQCFLSDIKLVKLPFPVCIYEMGGLSEDSQEAGRNIEETKNILINHGLSYERYMEELYQSHLVKEVYKHIYNEWVSLLQAGYSMERYLKHRDYCCIAVYGYGELGCRVIRELADSKIEIKMIIERAEKYPYSRIPIVKPSEITGNESVDAMIVTAIMHFNEIYESYKDIVTYPIISLESILEDMWRWPRCNTDWNT